MAQAITWDGGKPYEYVDGSLQELKQPDLFTMPDGTKFSYNADGSVNTNPNTGYAASGSALGLPQWLLNGNQGQDISSGNDLPLGGSNSWSIGDQVYSGSQWYGDGPSPWGKDTGDTFYNYQKTPALQAAAQTGKISALNGSPYNTYDGSGNRTGSGNWANLTDSNSNTTDAVVTAIVGAILGGAGAFGGAAGAGAGAAEGAAGSGAGFVGEGAASGVGAWDSALAGATAGDVGAAAAGAGTGYGSGTSPATSSGLESGTGSGFVGEGTTSGVPAWDAAPGSGASPGISDMFSQVMANNQVSGAVKNYLASSLLKSFLGSGGGGGSGGNSSGGGGMGLNDLVGILGGANDANAQGQAAAKMKEWLLSQSNKMEGYMNPDSPEYSAMWQQMSRKDAAAGRNSQYGVRTSDFLANIAKQKSANTLAFTAGNSRAYADALNQDASKYSGISAALQRALAGGGGGQGGVGLQQIINALTGGGGPAAGARGALDFGTGSGSTGYDNQQVLNTIGSQGAPIDYGSDATDESAVWDSILNGWGF